MAKADSKVKSIATKQTPKEITEPAEFEYIGDDGGRWLFQRRSDGLCFTIDKPRGIVLQAKTPPLSCRLTVRGQKFNDTILSMVRK